MILIIPVIHKIVKICRSLNMNSIHIFVDKMQERINARNILTFSSLKYVKKNTEKPMVTKENMRWSIVMSPENIKKYINWAKIVI